MVGAEGAWLDLDHPGFWRMDERGGKHSYLGKIMQLLDLKGFWGKRRGDLSLLLPSLHPPPNMQTEKLCKL